MVGWECARKQTGATTTARGLKQCSTDKGKGSPSSGIGSVENCARKHSRGGAAASLSANLVGPRGPQTRRGGGHFACGRHPTAGQTQRSEQATLRLPPALELKNLQHAKMVELPSGALLCASYAHWHGQDGWTAIAAGAAPGWPATTFPKDRVFVMRRCAPD